MKSLLLGMAAAIAAVSPTVMLGADTPKNNWKYNKGINIGFITHQGLKDIDSWIPFQYDSSFGISFSTGASYLWPRSEGWAGNRVKVGIDARWFEISYVKYKKFPKIDGIQLEGWNEDMDDEWDDDEIDNMHTQQVHMGVGLGPTVACVPFPNADSALKFLRVNLTAHFNPSASMLLYKDNYGDMDVSWAFVPAFDFGMNFQWKNFVLGFEGKWGRAKYKSLFGEDDFEDSFDYNGISLSSNQKQTFKNSSFRINIGLRF